MSEKTFSILSELVIIAHVNAELIGTGLAERLQISELISMRRARAKGVQHAAEIRAALQQH